MSVAFLRIAGEARQSRTTLRIHPLVGIRVAVALLIVANLGRVPLLSTGDREAPLLLNDLCMLFVVALGALVAIVKRSVRIDRLTMLALLFASIGLYSALLAVPRYGLTQWQLVISLAYLARWLVYFALYVVVINLLRPEDIRPLWRTLEGTIIAMAAFGILQAIFIPHFAQVVYPDSRVYIDFDEQGHRLVSTILEPNMAGAMIMMVLLVQLAQVVGGVRISFWKPLLLFTALVATLSRSSFLGLIVGAAVILGVRGLSKRVLRNLAIVTLIGLASAPWVARFATSYNKLRIDASALSRIAQWFRALRIFADHPIFGIGFNTYAFVQESYGYVRLGSGSYSLDGGLLFIAVMTGVVGLLVYLAMLTLVIRRCRTVWRSLTASAESRSFATGIAAATIALCAHSFFVNSLLTPFVMEPLFLLWAMSFLMARELVDAPVRIAPTLALACPS